MTSHFFVSSPCLPDLDVNSVLAETAATIARRLLAGWAILSVDIETNPADSDRIFKLGVARSDTNAVVSLSTRGMTAEEVAGRVNAVSQGAQFLLGHNLRRHDLPELRRQHPGLGLHDLWPIDTLELSAIAFPTNPHHRLVKGYKLLSDSRNDPLKDARLALDLLSDEIAALLEMQEADPCCRRPKVGSSSNAVTQLSSDAARGCASGRAWPVHTFVVSSTSAG